MKRAAEEDFPRGGVAAAAAGDAPARRPKKRAIALPRLEAEVRRRARQQRRRRARN
jgi:hypothetical protein